MERRNQQLKLYHGGDRHGTCRILGLDFRNCRVLGDELVNQSRHFDIA